MELASLFFLLFFLPISFWLYYHFFKSVRQKQIFLFLASYMFYAFAGWQFVFLLLGLSFATFYLGRRLNFSFGIWLNFLALLLFKYWNFGVDNLNYIFSNLNLEAVFPVFRIGLPLGISFFVFKHIGYLMDLRQKRYSASSSFLVFTVFSAFFAQISAGPISGYKDTARQLEELPDALDRESLYIALIHLGLGLVKKVLIADVLANAFTPYLASVESISSLPTAWYVILTFAMQLYFDFSGYTDMALGVGLLFGVSLPANFNNPYYARDPREFWERWHMSLSAWFRIYFFFPLSRSLLIKLGGNRKIIAQYFANLVTMTLVGFWHGTSLGYILWGAYHGLLLSVNASFARQFELIPLAIRRFSMFLLIMLGWAIFLSPNGGYLSRLLYYGIGAGGFGTWDTLVKLAIQPASWTLLIALILAYSGRIEADNLLQVPSARSKIFALIFGIIIAVSLLYLTESTQFLYVQF